MADATETLAEGLTRAMQRMGAGAVEGLRRLTGGANMESWSFDYGGAGYVLRRAPSAEMMEGRPYGHDVEAAIIRAACAAGVLAPEIVLELEAADGLGSGYVMRRVEADVNPAIILADPPASLLADLGRELAATHRIPVDAVAGVPTMDTAEALAELKRRFIEYGGDRPIQALAIRWLEDHLPGPVEPALVHGDFRMGNVMVGKHGLAVVLDWELAHLGDPHEDLAYGCLNVWRFGHMDKPAFGVGALEDLFAAYEANGGRTVDRARFRFWLVYRTLWWALGCIGMTAIWRSGLDRSLERAVIGRRTVENETDLLLLLEGDAPEAERQAPLPPSQPATPASAGESSAEELLTAVAEWIESDIKAKASGRDKFQAVVALNALGMVRRELARPAPFTDKALAADLLAGRASLATPGLLPRLRRMALDKLANDVPKYAALKEARTLWRG